MISVQPNKWSKSSFAQNDETESFQTEILNRTNDNGNS